MCSVQTFASVCVQVKHPYVLEQFSSCLHFYVQFCALFCFVLLYNFVYTVLASSFL